VRHSSGKEDRAPRYEAAAELEDHPVTQFASRWNHHRVTGPMEWLYTVCNHTLTICHLLSDQLQDQAQDIALAVGITGGLLTISLRRSAYDGTSTKKPQIQTRDWPFEEPTAENHDPPKRHWDPITGKECS
jgi:hypothetical protein